MRARAEAGFTILEVTVAMAVIVVTMLGLAASMALALARSGVSTDTRLAIEAARGRIEEMRAAPFLGLLDAWSGRTFGVSGLRPPADGGPLGAVLFLTEREVAEHLGLVADPVGVDLDGDGAPNESLPPGPLDGAYGVRVTVRWGDSTVADDRRIDVTTVIFDVGR